MSASLKLVPAGDDLDPVEDRLEIVKALGDRVDDLIARCEALREETEGIRLSLGLSRLEYAEWRDGGFSPCYRRAPNTVAAVAAGAQSALLKLANDDLDKISQRLERYLCE